jgi:hypothetical protein
MNSHPRSFVKRLRAMRLIILLYCLGASPAVVCVFGQDSVESRVTEWKARGRALLAERVPSVTAKQCLSDITSWAARDDADTKAKVNSPDYWYEKLSTEEVMRLAAESLSCWRIIDRNGHATLVGYELRFNVELWARAKAILIRHDLLHELLLESGDLQ